MVCGRGLRVKRRGLKRSLSTSSVAGNGRVMFCDYDQASSVVVNRKGYSISLLVRVESAIRIIRVLKRALLIIYNGFEYRKYLC